MSKIRETVDTFLRLPITNQQSIMSKFGFNYNWNCSPIRQRMEFFSGIREDDRVDEFCDYILGRYKK